MKENKRQKKRITSLLALVFCFYFVAFRGFRRDQCHWTMFEKYRRNITKIKPYPLIRLRRCLRPNGNTEDTRHRSINLQPKAVRTAVGPHLQRNKKVLEIRAQKQNSVGRGWRGLSAGKLMRIGPLGRLSILAYTLRLTNGLRTAFGVAIIFCFV